MSSLPATIPFAGIPVKDKFPSGTVEKVADSASSPNHEDQRNPLFELVEEASTECGIERNNNKDDPGLREPKVQELSSDGDVCVPMLFEGPIGYEADYTMTIPSFSVYGCKICFTIAGSSVQAFQRHQKEFHTDLQNCKVCFKTYRTKRGLENHMMTHIRYPCQHCEKDFRHLNEVEEHQKAHHSRKLFLCQSCGEEFYLQASYNQHNSFPGGCAAARESARKILKQPSNAKSKSTKTTSCRINVQPQSNRRMEEKSNKEGSTDTKRNGKKYECKVCSAVVFSFKSMKAHKLSHL